MNILFVNKFFFLNGGSETVYFQEREFLQNNDIKVIDFSMVDDRNFPSKYSDNFVPNVNYNDIEGIWKKIKQGLCFVHHPAAVSSIERLVAQEKPEIAHLHNIYHQLTPSIIPILKKHGVKVVLTLHDYKLICPSYLALKNEQICIDCEGKYFIKPFTGNCQNSRMQGLLLAVEAFWHKWKKSYDSVDQFISPSSFLADLTSKRIPRKKIRVLHNGIDVNAYRPNYNDDGYGLYFGRLSKEKGIVTLLEAHKKLNEKVPLKIVGTGPLEADLKNAYTSAEFLGYCEGDELKNIIANSAFVVVPSEWYENCSMVVLEAMAMGKPVIGSRIGGIPEQVEDGKEGFLFEMANVDELSEKMKLLAENPSMRTAFGMAARKKLEQEYSLENHCQDLLKIYRDLLN